MGKIRIRPDLNYGSEFCHFIDEFNDRIVKFRPNRPNLLTMPPGSSAAMASRRTRGEEDGLQCGPWAKA
jgi:hypothetical protein